MPEFSVPDMDCEGCVAAIARAVQNLDPKATVVADLKTKQVKIDSRLDQAKLIGAVREAGFAAQAT